MADAYSGIDFDEINEATGLAADEIKCLKVSYRILDKVSHELNIQQLNTGQIASCKQYLLKYFPLDLLRLV